jgi:hypothetical protein
MFITQLHCIAFIWDEHRELSIRGWDINHNTEFRTDRHIITQHKKSSNIWTTRTPPKNGDELSCSVPASYKTPAVLLIYTVKFSKILQISAADAKATQTRLRCSYVEVIATNIIRSPSQSSWPLRNIHISNDNRSFTFYVTRIILRPLSTLSLDELMEKLTIEVKSSRLS